MIDNEKNEEFRRIFDRDMQDLSSKAMHLSYDFTAKIESDLHVKLSFEQFRTIFSKIEAFAKNAYISGVLWMELIAENIL